MDKKRIHQLMCLPWFELFTCSSSSFYIGIVSNLCTVCERTSIGTFMRLAHNFIELIKLAAWTHYAR